MIKVLVIIPTHKRPEWCTELLTQIVEQQKEFNVKVAVFHDWDASDYSEVIKICTKHNWSYFKSKQNFGKWRFWELNNLMYQYASTQDFKYIIQLPDDGIIVDYFFNRICGLMKEDNDCINPFTLNLHSELFARIEKKAKQKYGELVPTNWADSCFITTKSVISKLRLTQPRNSINKDETKGSGCGHLFSEIYKEQYHKRILQTRNALIYHRGYAGKSVMHNSDRWEGTFNLGYQSKMLLSDWNYCKKFDKQEINNSFEKLVKGKTIAFVGLAPNIQGKSLGKEIDSADIVYRTNMFPIPEKYTQDYGTRCDILGIQRAYEQFVDEYIYNGVKLIVYYEEAMKMPENSYCSNYYERMNMASEINSIILEYRMKAPTAGLVAWFLCHKYGCKSFKFYGITGYQNLKGEVQNHDGGNNYLKEYLDYWGNRKDRLIKTDMVHNEYHNFQAHNEFIKYGIKNKFFTLDKYSNEYFK